MEFLKGPGDLHSAFEFKMVCAICVSDVGHLCTFSPGPALTSVVGK